MHHSARVILELLLKLLTLNLNLPNLPPWPNLQWMQTMLPQLNLDKWATM
jgi:hypothetical protein